jgi:hypothetical protein
MRDSPTRLRLLSLDSLLRNLKAMSDNTANPVPLTILGASVQAPSQDERIVFAAALPTRPPSTFHPFGDLPREICCMIWEAAKPGPRIVRARLNDFKGGLCTRVCKYYSPSNDVSYSKISDPAWYVYADTQASSWFNRHID